MSNYSKEWIGVLGGGQLGRMLALEARRMGFKVLKWTGGDTSGAAHLPGMAAAITPLPVLGVPIESRTLKGVDSLLSIVQMPAGIPTATFAIGVAGAKNAALFAVAQLAAAGDEKLAEKLKAFREEQRQRVEGDAILKLGEDDS